jgi:Tfp pilus assembly protein PilV
MDCKITSTSQAVRARQGVTILEVLIAMPLMLLLLFAVTTFMVFTSYSFASLFNYIDLDDRNRVAIDQLTRDVRQARRVSNFTPSRLQLEDSDGGTLVYEYSSGTHQMVRTKSGQSQVLLKGCDWLTFVIGQRTPVGGSYDVYPAATPATAKVVNVSWVCSRNLAGFRVNTESVQTARIVIRKQGT